MSALSHEEIQAANSRKTLEQFRDNEARTRLAARPVKDLVARYVAGMAARGELVPGGAEPLLKLVAKRGGDVNAAFGEIGRLFAEGGEGRAYLNPERPKPETPEAPLRAALARFAIGAAKVGELYNAHAGSVARSPEADAPRDALRILSRYENMALLDTPKKAAPEPTAGAVLAVAADVSGARHAI